VLAKKF